MKWVLVFIIIKNVDGVVAESIVVDEPFETMQECFQMRELLSLEVGGQDGYYPVNTQALCVRTDQ